MNAEELMPADEQCASLLAACHKALVAGEAAMLPGGLEVPPELRARLERDLACLRLLEQSRSRQQEAARAEAVCYPAVEPEEPSGELPANIGRFQVRRELGRGGYGIVFLAYDSQLGREVALKVPRAEALLTAELRERFLREARAAALLDHPNVVPVYDAGEIGPVCYIASAYCPGITLADWFKERTELVPVRAAAALVGTLARAVEHAHRHGVIHRDLKPANILLVSGGAVSGGVVSGGVVSGEVGQDMGRPLTTHHSPLTTPRITDFGLAKLLAGEAGVSAPRGQTQSGVIIGTPHYMAPEQAEGKSRQIGPAADIYALGAILYELLTGRPPFQAESTLSILMLVRAVEPVPPRRLRLSLPRDLETICLKCLQKEPAKRYTSASALADDLERFLDGKPIRARPIGAWERTVKWARRKPYAAALAGVSGLAVVTLFGVILGFTVQLRAALKVTQAERDRAEAREEEANRAREEEAHQRAVAQAVSDFLQLDLLGQADIGNQPLFTGQAQRDRDIKVRELLDRAAAAIEGKFRDQPEVEAAIRHTIGDAYRALGAYDKAQEQLYRAVAWRLQHLGADHPDTLTSKNDLATLYYRQGKYAQAESLFLEVLQVRTAKLGPDHVDTLTSMNNLAGLYLAQAKYTQAETLLMEALPTQTAKLGADHPNTLLTKNNLIGLYLSQAKHDLAEPLLMEVLQACTAKLGADHPDTLISMNNLAGLYKAQGKHDRAVPILMEVLQARTAKLGVDHPDTLNSMNNLAGLYRDQGKYHQAEPLYLEVLQARTAQLGADHPDTLISKNNLGGLYWRQGKYDLAEPLFKEVLQAFTAQLGADHHKTLGSKNNLAGLYQRQGKYDLAEPLFKEVLQSLTAQLGADHPNTLTTKNSLAGLYQEQERYDQAEPLLKEVLQARTAKLGPDHPDVAATLASLGFNYLGQKRYAAAEPHLRAALAIYGKEQPEEWWHFQTQSLLGSSLLGQQQYAVAEPLLLQGYQGLKSHEKQIPPYAKSHTAEAAGRLVQLYDAWGKPEQAKEWQQRLEQTKNPRKEPAR